MFFVRYGIAVVLGGCITFPAFGVTLIAPTEADTHVLHGSMGYAYPDSPVARTTSWVRAESYFRFDLSEFEDFTAEEVVSATFKVFTGEGTGSMATPPAQAGIAQQAHVVALRTWDPTTHVGGLECWTEAAQGDYEGGYLYKGNDPGTVGGLDPYEYEDTDLVTVSTGSPSAIMTHATGPDTWASVDLTEFVQAWLPGGELDIVNNGIRVHDCDDDYGWYFFTKDYDSDTGSSGTPDHPGAAYVPYLEIEFSLQGDLNDDGFVGGDDLDIVRSYWGEHVDAGDLSKGDISGDGFVGGDDLDIVRANWGRGIPLSAAAAVPEPTTGALLAGLAAFGFFWFRRKVGSVPCNP